MLNSLPSVHPSTSPIPTDADSGEHVVNKFLTPETLLESRSDLKTAFDFQLGVGNGRFDFTVPPRSDSSKIADKQILSAWASLSSERYTFRKLANGDGSMIVCTPKPSHSLARHDENLPRVTLRLDKNAWLKSAEDSSGTFCAFFEKKRPSPSAMQTKRPKWILKNNQLNNQQQWVKSHSEAPFVGQNYKDSVAGWEATATSNEIIVAELDRLVVQAGTETRISASDIPLTGYLLARSSLGRTIDDLRGLRSGQKTLKATQAAYPFGRANIVDDLQRSEYQSIIRLMSQRDLQDELLAVFRKWNTDDNTVEWYEFDDELMQCWPKNYFAKLQRVKMNPEEIYIFAREVAKTACSLYGQASACAELSGHVAQSHATELALDEQVKTFHLGTQTGAHMWTEVTKTDGKARNNDVVIDPWTGDRDFGTTILREDAQFQHQDNHSELYFGATKVTGERLMRHALRLLKKIKGNPAAITFFKDAVEKNTPIWTQNAKVSIEWLEAFASLGIEKDQVGDIYPSPPFVLRREFRNEAEAAMPKLPLQKEIIGAGIGRNFGLSTERAVATAQDNFAAASAAADRLIRKPSSTPASLIGPTPSDRKWENFLPLWKQAAVLIRNFPKLGVKILDGLEKGFQAVESQPDEQAGATLEALFAEFGSTTDAVATAIDAGKLPNDQYARLVEIVRNAANGLQKVVEVELKVVEGKWKVISRPAMTRSVE